MRRIRRSTFAILAVLLASGNVVSPLSAQAGTTSFDMQQRFYRGRQLLNAAAEAAGGSQAIRAITAVSFTARGDTYNDVQGYSAARIGQSVRDGRLAVTNNFDFAGGRFSQRTQQELGGGFALDSSVTYINGTTYSLRNNGQEFLQSPGTPSPTAAGGFFMPAARWSPPLMLQRALQNFRSVTYVGEGVAAGVPADIIEFSFDEATRVRLYITKTDKRISRLESVVPDAISADDVSVVEFDGEQTIGGIKFPTHLNGYRRGVRAFDISIEAVAVNPTLADSTFLPPANYRLVTDDVLTTTRINDRIYEVSGLGGGAYRSQFVVMDDFVVAFEAPLGIGASRQIIAEIRRVAGEKPIRYVVISHFHSDHAGGVGAYVDIGATVVASDENQDVLRTYANARSQSLGMSGSQNSPEMKFEPVGPSGYTIRDSKGQSLRIIDFVTPHAAHVLALYDPASRTIMNGDLYSRLVRWNATFDVFARWLRNNRTPVTTILGTHHAPTTRAQILEAATGR